MIDMSGRLGLVECLDLNQDMITEFFGSVGSDNRILRKENNAAWIYTRTKFHIEDLPFWNTRTEARTFVSAKSPIRLTLETALRGEGGKILFAAKTEMCAIDFAERKIRPIGTLTFPTDLEAEPSLVEAPFEKLKTDFCEDDFVYEEKVYACDMDFTRHTNNTRYLKYLMNTFPQEFFTEKSVTDLDILFAKESSAGSLLRIYKKDLGENTIAFQICSEGEAVVKALLKFSDTAPSWDGNF